MSTVRSMEAFGYSVRMHLMFLVILRRPALFFFFFFNDTATTEIYTLSLHDALPISPTIRLAASAPSIRRPVARRTALPHRSEEHTSELQSPCNLVCRLLLEKKKKNVATSLVLRISR